MKYTPAPEILTQKIARRAVEIAQFIGPRKTGKGLNSLVPIYKTGVVGIEIPDNTSYMFDLDRGIKEHAMMNLAGKIIPFRTPGGGISFRRATVNNIGAIPIISRSSKDGRIISGKPEWVYPRKDGLFFLQKSLQLSVQEWKKTATSKEIIDLFMKTDARDDLEQIIYGK